LAILSSGTKQLIPWPLISFEKRADLAPHGKTGWKDCGANMKEANSHATTVIGMCDLLGLGFENYLTEDQQSRLVRQIINGCDYLALCQDKAEDIGFDKGSIIHEIPNNMILSPGDTAQSVVETVEKVLFLQFSTESW
jgi:hypothetical protein